MVLREILHAHIPLLNSKSTLQDAVDKMDIYQFPALIFIDSGNKAIAVITEGDICAAIKNQNPREFALEPAISFATLNPRIASPETTAEDALKIMQSDKLTVLPIVEENSLLGMVLRVDLLQAMMQEVIPPQAPNDCL